MARIFEEISRANANSAGKTDANLSQDSNNLGGIPADDYATKKYVQKYHDDKEAKQKEYIDKQDENILEAAKEYTNTQIRNQDFSNFAELNDLDVLNKNLTGQLQNCQKECANNLKTTTDKIVKDVNDNFNDVNTAIDNLNKGQTDLFQSVSNGKRKVAEAITDKGVTTSATDTFDTMAGNVRKIQTGGEIDPNFVNTSDGTATDADILLGKTAYVKGEKIYGNHVCSGIDTSDATAMPSDILTGKTAYARGHEIIGTYVPESSGGGEHIDKIYGTNIKTIKNGQFKIPQTRYSSYETFLYNYIEKKYDTYIWGDNQENFDLHWANYTSEQIIKSINSNTYENLNIKCDENEIAKNVLCAVPSSDGRYLYCVASNENKFKGGINVLPISRSSSGDITIKPSIDFSSHYNSTVISYHPKLAVSSDGNLLAICQNANETNSDVDESYVHLYKISNETGRLIQQFYMPITHPESVNQIKYKTLTARFICDSSILMITEMPSAIQYSTMNKIATPLVHLFPIIRENIKSWKLGKEIIIEDCLGVTSSADKILRCKSGEPLTIEVSDITINRETNSIAINNTQTQMLDENVSNDEGCSGALFMQDNILVLNLGTKIYVYNVDFSTTQIFTKNTNLSGFNLNNYDFDSLPDNTACYGKNDDTDLGNIPWMFIFAESYEDVITAIVYSGETYYKRGF